MLAKLTSHDFLPRYVNKTRDGIRRLGIGPALSAYLLLAVLLKSQLQYTSRIHLSISPFTHPTDLLSSPSPYAQCLYHRIISQLPLPFPLPPSLPLPFTSLPPCSTTHQNIPTNQPTHHKTPNDHNLKRSTLPHPTPSHSIQNSPILPCPPPPPPCF